MFLFKPKADLNGYLEFLDFTVFNQPSHFHHFKPVYIAQRLAGLRHGVFGGLGKTYLGSADDFNFLVCSFHSVFLGLPRSDFHALFFADLLLRVPYFEQFVEEGAVMHNGFAQLLGVCPPALITQGDSLRRSVICYNVGVID